MRALWRQSRSFSPTARWLMANQFAINLAFYMLMPYLAAHLAGQLGLAAWAVGLVLGVRNLSQQGMFVLGGALADRYGYKIPIIAGCLLRTGAFAMLGFAISLPLLLLASAATGLAGALFNPAVRAYLAVEAGERRIEAFAVFNVYYQAGMLAGPLVGIALLTVDFTLVCTLAAAVFAALAAIQIKTLSQLAPAPPGNAAQASTWRTVAGNRPFWLFTGSMTGNYVLTFQVYLALPLALRTVLPPGGANTATTAVFVASAVTTACVQLRVTAWARRCWQASQAIARGLILCALAFTPVLATALLPVPASVSVAAVILTAILLALGTGLIYPFEMDTLLTLADPRRPATCYGLYNTVCGVGITAGNFAVGSLWSIGARYASPWLAWSALIAVGLLGAAAVAALGRRGRLQPQHAPTAPVAASA